jgi:hypothetical protein
LGDCSWLKVRPLAFNELTRPLITLPSHLLLPGLVLPPRPVFFTPKPSKKPSTICPTKKEARRRQEVDTGWSTARTTGPSAKASRVLHLGGFSSELTGR